MDKALKQYIELYDENREVIGRNSSGVLNDVRERAVDVIRDIRLPRKGSENYELTDLPEILGFDYGVNINNVPLPINPAESFRCGIPRVATSLFFMVNDRFAETTESRKMLPEGIEIGSLKDFSLKDPEMVAAHYGCLANMENPIVALSSLLAQDGLWIRVKKGVKVETPVQIVNILGGSDNMLTPLRIVIIMEEDSEMKILFCEHSSHSNVNQLGLAVTEVYAGRNSKLNLYSLEESGATTRRLSSLWLRQEEGSDVVVNGMTVYNGITRSEYHCSFVGNDAVLKLYGMGIADSDRLIDVYSNVRHDCERCRTDELFKFSVDDEAKCGFTGMIRVAEHAPGNEAYQSNRNLIGSNEARMFSKPQLEIYNDDVKCSHGSSTGQLDELQLFYMRTRGLSEPEARMLLKQAFMADVIDRVEIPGLKERLAHIVARRFAGESIGCRDCSLECM